MSKNPIQKEARAAPPSQPKAPAPVASATALVLRTCDADRQGHNKFQWPESGLVEAPDWDPRAVCGGGLHGLLWGEGDGTLLNWEPSAVWLVVEVATASIVNLNGKVKFPRGDVVHCGTRLSATSYLAERAPGHVIVGGTATAGYSGTATAGYAGTATAGYSGTATAGVRGTATAGDYGTATAGYAGTATAGYFGTATAGYSGTATAGDYGTATAGVRGTLLIRWYDGDRYRIATFYVGEDGVLPNRAYRVDGAGKRVLVDLPAVPAAA